MSLNFTEIDKSRTNALCQLQTLTKSRKAFVFRSQRRNQFGVCAKSAGRKNDSFCVNRVFLFVFAFNFDADHLTVFFNQLRDFAGGTNLYRRKF